MADTVTSQIVNDGPKYVTVVLTSESDGTGEAGVAKVDLSALHAHNGTLAKLCVEEIQYDVAGFNYVTLAFDRTTDQPIAVLAGQGYINWRDIGGKTDDGAGGTGDILLTTDGAVDGSSYTITLVCRKKYG